MHEKAMVTATAPRLGIVVASWRPFIASLIQLQLAMCIGAVVCYLLGVLAPRSSTVASVYYPGAYLYTAGDMFFLTVPVVLWMLLRGQGWRRGIEMAFAMIAPVAVIVGVGELWGFAYRPWLIIAGYPAMSIGMLACLLYRRNLLDRHVNASVPA
jgi:hypothetical protein